jgi:OmpA-OmpF porin, OOP family
MKRLVLLCSMLVLAACAPPPPAPPPAPPPPPMAAAPQIFTVYFGWDRSWVGPLGIQILQQAANAYHAGGPVAVHVTGYTDTSGSPGFNDRLSTRRADHVARILARMGVPWQAMTIVGEGENGLAVPTPPGVPDARNRRVTIAE